ncbi:hypothetical protein D1007_49839 [Hordeum vulgare]|nr:hypothetical protein D1007_49839 [Hordeum vulgare]
MVYEDESSNDLSSLDISSSSDGMMYQILASIDDEDYMGIENSALDVCSEHGMSPERRVAFEGFETGRRLSLFLIPPLSLFITNGQVLSDCLLLKMELRQCVLRASVLQPHFLNSKGLLPFDNCSNNAKLAMILLTTSNDPLV